MDIGEIIGITIFMSVCILISVLTGFEISASNIHNKICASTQELTSDYEKCNYNLDVYQVLKQIPKFKIREVK